VSQNYLKNGKTYEGDFFIAACDAVLYRGLLKGQYPDRAFEMRYNNPKDYPLASNIYIGIGYEGTMEGIPRTLKFQVDLFMINETPVKYLQMTHYGYEPDFAPKGHTAITFAINQFQQDLDFWEELDKDRQAYKEEKNRIGTEVIRSMESRFPYMQGILKLLDVAKPRTYERYCNAYRGAFMAFWPTLHGKELNHTGNIKIFIVSRNYLSNWPNFSSNLLCSLRKKFFKSAQFRATCILGSGSASASSK